MPRPARYSKGPTYSRKRGRKFLKKMIKTNNRLEFSAKTKKLIEDAAGGICAIPKCLKKTRTIAMKENGEIKSANFGKASHIYAASPDGPRPRPPGMTDEQLQHHSNGIWTCADCGDEIDVLTDEYKAPVLFEMKKVREAAHKMVVRDKVIKSTWGFIPQYELDGVFWKYSPNLESPKIRLEILELIADAIHRYVNNSRSPVQVPTNLVMRPLASALKNFSTEKDFSPVRIPFGTRVSSPQIATSSNESYGTAQARTSEIEAAWANSIKVQSVHRHAGYTCEISLEITARHPHSGVLCDSRIKMNGSGYAKLTPRDANDEVTLLRVETMISPVNNIRWGYRITFDQGETQSTSVLTVAQRHHAQFFNTHLWYEDVDAYGDVLKRFAEGWEPVGFIGLVTGRHPLAKKMHSHAFDIDLNITPTSLNVCLRQWQKINLAKQIVEKWTGGPHFVFTDAYFHDDLDVDTIQSASERLREELGPPPYWHKGESPVLLSANRMDFRLVVQAGKLSIKSKPRW